MRSGYVIAFLEAVERVRVCYIMSIRNGYCNGRVCFPFFSAVFLYESAKSFGVWDVARNSHEKSFHCILWNNAVIFFFKCH